MWKPAKVHKRPKNQKFWIHDTVDNTEELWSICTISQCSESIRIKSQRDFRCNTWTRISRNQILANLSFDAVRSDHPKSQNRVSSFWFTDWFDDLSIHHSETENSLWLNLFPNNPSLCSRKSIDYQSHAIHSDATDPADINNPSARLLVSRIPIWAQEWNFEMVYDISGFETLCGRELFDNYM